MTGMIDIENMHKIINCDVWEGTYFLDHLANGQETFEFVVCYVLLKVGLEHVRHRFLGLIKSYIL